MRAGLECFLQLEPGQSLSPAESPYLEKSKRLHEVDWCFGRWEGLTVKLGQLFFKDSVQVQF